MASIVSASLPTFVMTRTQILQYLPDYWGNEPEMVPIQNSVSVEASSAACNNFTVRLTTFAPLSTATMPGVAVPKVSDANKIRIDTVLFRANVFLKKHGLPLINLQSSVHHLIFNSALLLYHLRLYYWNRTPIPADLQWSHKIDGEVENGFNHKLYVALRLTELLLRYDSRSGNNANNMLDRMITELHRYFDWFKDNAVAL